MSDISVLILAGQREGVVDPLCAETGVARKALVPILNCPMIDYVMDALEAAGIAAPFNISGFDADYDSRLVQSPSAPGPAGSAHEPAINFLRATFRGRTLAEWQEWFEGRDICWSPVLDLQEAWSADHVWARDMRWRDQDGNDHIGTPLKFQQEPGQLDAKLPNLGEHTAEIVADLDLTPGQRREILERLN